MTKVIGIKANDKTVMDFDKIPKESNKDWLEDKVREDTEREKIAFHGDDKPEKFITIPASEYEFLTGKAGAMVHATYIFERIVKRAKENGLKIEFDSLFVQLESFWSMNGLLLRKRKDGSEWVIDCQHDIGKSFGRFFYHMMKKICNQTGRYDLYDKKILEDSLVMYVKAIPVSQRVKKQKQKKVNQ